MNKSNCHFVETIKNKDTEKRPFRSAPPPTEKNNIFYFDKKK